MSIPSSVVIPIACLVGKKVFITPFTGDTKVFSSAIIPTPFPNASSLNNGSFVLVISITLPLNWGTNIIIFYFFCFKFTKYHLSSPYFKNEYTVSDSLFVISIYNSVIIETFSFNFVSFLSEITITSSKSNAFTFDNL